VSAAGRVKSLKGVITAETRAPRLRRRRRASRERHGRRHRVLQFTSGSTSTPKGVEVTHANLAANARAIIVDGLKADPARDHGVSWLPLYHDMGLIGFVLSPMFHRISVTFIPTMSFVRNATMWLDVIHEKRGTITFAPNFAYALAAKAREAAPAVRSGTCRACASSAAAPSRSTRPPCARSSTSSRRAPEAAIASLPCYGMARGDARHSLPRARRRAVDDIIDRKGYENAKRAEPAHVSKLEDGSGPRFVSCGKTFPSHDVGAFDDQGRRLRDRHSASCG